MTDYKMPDGKPVMAYRPRACFGGLITVTGPTEQSRIAVRRKEISRIMNRMFVFSRHKFLSLIGGMP